MRGRSFAALILLACLTACWSDGPDTLSGPNGDIDCLSVIDRHVGASFGWDTQANVLDVTTDHVVLQLRVDAKAPLDDSHLRAGLRDLARNAQHVW